MAHQAEKTFVKSGLSAGQRTLGFAMSVLNFMFRRIFRESPWKKRRLAPLHGFGGEPLEPRQCMSADGLPGGVYQAGNVNQSDIAMLADVARARYGVDGSGIKIGVLSVSYNNLGGAEYDISHGALPSDVTVVHDTTQSENPQIDDEGRAMLQLVHSIAPGAELYFSTGYDVSGIPEEDLVNEYLVNFQNQFAERIRELVDVYQCDILIDDLIMPLEPWFQDGPISQAIDYAVQQGTAYFAFAGNNGSFSYESDFRPVATPSELLTYEQFAGRTLQFHDFDNTEEVNVFQKITLPEGSNLSLESPFVLQWDQPWGHNDSEVEVWLFDSEKNPVSRFENLGGQGYPVAARIELPESFTVSSPVEFSIAFVHVAGESEPPGFFKWIWLSNGQGNLSGEFGSAEFAVAPGGSTIFGHSNSSLGASVAAAEYWATPAYDHSAPEITGFSSWGGTPILFEVSGQRLSEPEFRQRPLFVAGQGGNTTFFGNGDFEADGLMNFTGTSAAAPNAGAMAALMLQLDPSLSPTDIYAILAETAASIPSPLFDGSGGGEVFNYATGAGLLQAHEALAKVAGLAIEGTVFEDFNRNGMHSSSDLPLSGVTIFLDSNGNGLRDSSGAVPVTHESNVLAVVSAAETITNPNRSLLAPPKPSTLVWPAKAYSGIDVTDLPGGVTDLEVSFSLHANAASEQPLPVFLTLINPQGIRVPLAGTAVIGGSYPDPHDPTSGQTSILVSDTQTVSRSFSMAPQTEANKSLVDLEAFSGTLPNGTWYLEVMNPDPSRTYTLENWSLSLKAAELASTTDATGNFRFPSQLLSLSSGVGTFVPTIELPENRRVVHGAAAKPVTLHVGDTAIANFAVSLPLIERPQLPRSTTLQVSGDIVGPSPISFSWEQVAAAILPDGGGWRFVVTSVSGRVEKMVGGTWVQVDRTPETSDPRELLRLLNVRTIQPGDQLRWIPPSQQQERPTAFSVFGWDGTAFAKTESSVDVMSTPS